MGAGAGGGGKDRTLTLLHLGGPDAPIMCLCTQVFLHVPPTRLSGGLLPLFLLDLPLGPLPALIGFPGAEFIGALLSLGHSSPASLASWGGVPFVESPPPQPSAPSLLPPARSGDNARSPLSLRAGCCHLV